jgi:hypothetical protein
MPCEEEGWNGRKPLHEIKKHGERLTTDGQTYLGRAF